ncbi:MAG TPA: rhomboid family intramembrane serine protease [Acidothermaceae bacterium]|jgi:membrane associated rhomboid family serine protease
MTADPGGPPGNLPPTGVGRTCYRHPNRPTALSCVRCERPICPDCMVEAPVGFQCRDCVRAASKSQRPTRTAFGGRSVTNRTAVTYTLIGINVAALLAEMAWPNTIIRFALVGGVKGQAGHGGLGVANGEYYRLVTAMFLHSSPRSNAINITHILFNMWALSVVGPPLEAWLGRWRYLTLYLLSGLAGSVLAYAVASRFSFELGASGAIFGLFGALFVLGRRLQFDMRPITTTIALNLAITFTVSNISWQAHVGGLIAGAGLGYAWGHAPRDKRTAIQLASSVALLALLVVVVVARTHQLNG